MLQFSSTLMRIPRIAVVLIILPLHAWAGNDAAWKTAEEPSQLAASDDVDLRGQLTYIFQHKPPFEAAYTLPGYNSLSPDKELSHSASATAYLGRRLWQGAELYLNGEMVLGAPFSGLTGLASVPNGELQKASGPNPLFYAPRVFLRQTWALGGEQEKIDAGINQLSNVTTTRRIVLSAGKMSVVDIFDVTTGAHDARNDFMNWVNVAAGAFDYAADVRGYSWGPAIELYLDNWAFRGGRFAVPRESNGLQLNYSLMNFHGDQIEIVRNHDLAGLDGKLRLLIFRNREYMGRFDDAMAFAATHGGGAPDVAKVRGPASKHGHIASVEQQLNKDVRFFSRWSWNDGQSEMFSYTEAERSTQMGVSVLGTAWERGNDTVGIAYTQNGLSKQHQDYLAAGGVGFLIGDGRLDYRPERLFESYYRIMLANAAWLTFDVQRIANPAYNADRGCVYFYGLRTHVEF